MTKHTAINAALVARGLLPLDFVCSCCGGELDRDDHMFAVPENAQPNDEKAEAIQVAYGYDVCSECAGRMLLCPDTGKAFHPDYHDEAAKADDGRMFYDEAALHRSDAPSAVHDADRRAYFQGV
jgi:hypothetical protein